MVLILHRSLVAPHMETEETHEAPFHLHSGSKANIFTSNVLMKVLNSTFQFPKPKTNDFLVDWLAIQIQSTIVPTCRSQA